MKRDNFTLPPVLSGELIVDNFAGGDDGTDLPHPPATVERRNKTKVELKIALPDNVIQRLDQALGTDEQRKVVKPVQPLGHRLIGKRET